MDSKTVGGGGPTNPSKSLILKRKLNQICRYDVLVKTTPDPIISSPKATTILWLIPSLLCAAGLTLIFSRAIDNYGHVCSSAVPSGLNVLNDPWGWLGTRIWRGSTPTPYYTGGLAILFKLFGYDTRLAMAGSCVSGAVAAYCLGQITRRRFGFTAALLAIIMFSTSPVIIRFSLAGGYHIWGLGMMMLAIDFADRHAMYSDPNSSRFYWLSGGAILLAGGARPELYALALPLVILLPGGPWKRIGYLIIAWAYPIIRVSLDMFFFTTEELTLLQRTVSDFSETVSYFTDRTSNIMKQQFWLTPFLWIGTGGLLYQLVRGNRLMPALFIYFSAIFAFLFMQGRFKLMEPEYYPPMIATFAPLISYPIGMGIDFVSGMIKARAPNFVASLAYGGAIIAFGILAYPRERIESLAPVVLHRVNASYGDMRTFISQNTEDDDTIALDYFGDMTWVMAEIQNDAVRHMWYYGINPEPMPQMLFDAMEGDRLLARQQWIRNGFEHYLVHNRPAYFLTPTDAEWRAHRHKLHYASNSLRPGLGQEILGSGTRIDLGDQFAQLNKVYSNDKVALFKFNYDQESMIRNGYFQKWTGSRVNDWVVFGARLQRIGDWDAQGVTVRLVAMNPAKPGGITQAFVPLMVQGEYLNFSVEARAFEADALSVNLYLTVDGEDRVYIKTHSGDGDWASLYFRISLKPGSEIQAGHILIGLKAGAELPAELRNVSASVGDGTG